MIESHVNIYDEDYKITISEEQAKKILNRIVQYMVDNNCIHGEKLHQSDECIIYAPDCLSDIIDNHITIEEE